MILEITGNSGVNRNYVQTLCMVFFPGAKFPPDETLTADIPVVKVRSDADDGKNEAYSRVEIQYKDKTTRKSSRIPLDNGHAGRERNIKISVGTAFFEAGRAFFGYTPPWGILTGVRPSKIAAEFIVKGMERDKIRTLMNEEYFVNPKKAALATNVAALEYEILKSSGDQTRSCSVYISVPFCPTRCAYCSFVSYSTPRLLSLIPEYVSRLCRDMERLSELIKRLGLRIRTVYIGGGTPTVLTAEQLDTLLETAKRCFVTENTEEFSLESGRPDTITEEKLRIARNHGVDRISINPQTLSDDLLSEIGRGHSVKQFYEAYEMAQKAGFRTINTDVICGLPGDNFYNFSNTVEKILDLRPENITYHTFCVKRSSEFLSWGGKLFDREGGDVGQCVDYAQLKSETSGYLPYYMYRQKNTVGNYENTGYSLPGHEGRYNIYIMEEIHSIFAAGAGAVTKLIDQTRRGEIAGFGHVRERTGKPPMKRVFMPKYPYEYLAMDESSPEFMRYYDEIEEFLNPEKSEI
ncbi:MAG: coproporphyrinogen dehydrogenase HemZ [Eubacteriales bacterium]|jgi:oxygen-independent coproporphyrinogen-3 oxidase